MLLYTDGSKQANGDVGSGWALYCVGNGIERIILTGKCHLDQKAEVIDAELHAISEAVAALGTIDTPPAKAYICADNTAAIFTINANADNAQYAREAIDHAATLVEKGWSFASIWTPSHCGIPGNERADNLANQGAKCADTSATCSGARTTKNWLLAECRRRLYSQWKKTVPSASATLRSPTHFDNLDWPTSRAVLRIFAGRTPSDPLQGVDPEECECETDVLTSHHLLTECPLLAEARQPILERLPGGVTLSPSLAIEPRYTQLFANFAKSTGLGIRASLRYGDYPPPSDSSHINIDPDPDPDPDCEADDPLVDENYLDEIPFGVFE
jgi:ribonuclease HI